MKGERSDNDGDSKTPRRRRQLPKGVYYTAVALLAWMVLMAWIAFADYEGETVFGMVTLFAVISLGIPAVLFNVRRHHDPGTGQPPSLHSWVRERFQTQTGPMPSRQAMVEVLLIPAAAAIGFTALAIVQMLVT